MSSNQKHTVSTDALDTLGTCPIPEGSGRDAIHLAVEPVICGVQALYAAQRIKIENGVAVPAVSMNWEDATGIVDPFLMGYVRHGEAFWLVVLPRTITSLRHVWSHPAFPEAATYHKDADEHYVTPDAWRTLEGNNLAPHLRTMLDWIEGQKRVGNLPKGLDFPAAREALDAMQMANNRQSVPAPEPVPSMAKVWMKEYCASIGERYEYIMAGAKRYLETGQYTYGEKDSGNLEGVDIPDEFWVKYHDITREDITEAIRNGPDFFSCSC